MTERRVHVVQIESDEKTEQIHIIFLINGQLERIKLKYINKKEDGVTVIGEKNGKEITYELSYKSKTNLL